MGMDDLTNFNEKRIENSQRGWWECFNLIKRYGGILLHNGSVKQLQQFFATAATVNINYRACMVKNGLFFRVYQKLQSSRHFVGGGAKPAAVAGDYKNSLAALGNAVGRAGGLFSGLLPVIERITPTSLPVIPQ